MTPMEDDIIAWIKRNELCTICRLFKLQQQVKLHLSSAFISPSLFILLLTQMEKPLKKIPLHVTELHVYTFCFFI